MTDATMPRRDLHREISESLAAMIERGVRPWVCPWDEAGGSLFPLRANGVRYQGINVLMLWAASARRGFVAPHWMTFQQAKEMGASVRKGAKSEIVVYVGKVEREGDEIDPATGQPVKRGVSFLKSYRVFNVEEIEGLPAQYLPRALPSQGWQGEAAAERFFDAVPAVVHHRGNAAFYSRTTDEITLPPRAAFTSAAGYYSTRAHELVHWTGAPHRLHREKGHRFGDRRYAFEELVAEMGAAFTLAHLGTALEPAENTAAYLASWAKCLRDEPRALFRAATLAEQALDHLVAYQPQRVLDAA